MDSQHYNPPTVASEGVSIVDGFSGTERWKVLDTPLAIPEPVKIVLSNFNAPKMVAWDHPKISVYSKLSDEIRISTVPADVAAKQDTCDCDNCVAVRRLSPDERLIRACLHELAHSTGHPKRLNRWSLVLAEHGNPIYNIEEVIAETVTGRVAAALGVHSADGDAAVKVYSGRYLDGALEFFDPRGVDGAKITSMIEADIDRAVQLMLGRTVRFPGAFTDKPTRKRIRKPRTVAVA